MHTSCRTRTSQARMHRARRSHRVLRPVAGQCFEIEVRQDGGQWLIRIPEIDGAASAPTRSAVELAARECIATHTGIPLGYISVWVRA